MVAFIFTWIICVFLLNNVPQALAITLAEEVVGQHFIKSTHGTYLGIRQAGKSVEVAVSLKPKACEQWIIEKRGHKVAFKPYCSRGIQSDKGDWFNRAARYLHSNADGSIAVQYAHTLPTNALWKPLKHSDESWSFTTGSRYLSVDNNGSASTENDLESTHFYLEPWTDPILSDAEEAKGIRYLKSAHGTFLRAALPVWRISTVWEKEPNKVDLVKNQTACAQWSIEEYLGNSLTVNIKSYCTEHKYLHENANGSMDILEYSSYTTTTWIPIKNGDGSWSILSDKGGYLSSDNNASVFTVKDYIEAGKFWFESLSGSTLLDSKDPSQEFAGVHNLKTLNGKFLRKHRSDVDFIETNQTLHQDDCTNWLIEKVENKDKIWIKSGCTPTQHLRVDGESVHLSSHVKYEGDWKAFKNVDGSWTFLDINNGFLSTSDDGSLHTVKDDLTLSTHFWLEPGNEFAVPADITGPHCIKTLNGEMYLHGGDATSNFDVGLSQQCSNCELWFIEKAKFMSESGISLKNYCSEKYLTIMYNMTARIEAVVLSKKSNYYDIWKPIMEGDGWTFHPFRQSAWLEIRAGNVTLGQTPSVFILIPWKNQRTEIHR